MNLPQTTQLEFQEEDHRYFFGGRELHAVTRILEPITMLDGIPKDILAAAADLGNKVHKACFLVDAGTLDEESLDPVLAGYVAAWRKFCNDSQARIYASEHRVMHVDLGYAGTLDCKAMIEGARWIIDRKTASHMPRTVWPQLSAYLEAEVWLQRKEMRAAELTRNTRRGCVVLAPDGTYVFRRARKSHVEDFNMFISAMNVYHWRRGG